MGWNEDGSAEIDAYVRGIKAESREQIADRLEEWSKKGVNIEWGDFPERAVLETAVKYLREAKPEKWELAPTHDGISAIDN